MNVVKKILGIFGNPVINSPGFEPYAGENGRVLTEGGKGADGDLVPDGAVRDPHSHHRRRRRLGIRPPLLDQQTPRPHLPPDLTTLRLLSPSRRRSPVRPRSPHHRPPETPTAPPETLSKQATDGFSFRPTVLEAIGRIYMSVQKTRDLVGFMRDGPTRSRYVAVLTVHSLQLSPGYRQPASP